jgi:hypothetical protein
MLHEYEKECRKIKANMKEQRERFSCPVVEYFS